MYPDKVAVLMKELERVLEDGRPVNDVAPLGSGLRIVKMVPGDTERVAASPTAQRVHELVAQVLEFCPGSEGIKKYVAGSVDAFVRFQLPTEFTLSPLQDPDLFDGAKIEQYEMRLWFAARVNVRDTPAGLALAAELREWMESFEKRYRG